MLSLERFPWPFIFDSSPPISPQEATGQVLASESQLCNETEQIRRCLGDGFHGGHSGIGATLPPYTVFRAFLGLVQLCTEAVAEIPWSHGPGSSHATQSTSSPHLGPSEIFLAVGVCKGDIVFLLLANSVSGWYLKNKIWAHAWKHFRKPLWQCFSLYFFI